MVWEVGGVLCSPGPRDSLSPVPVVVIWPPCFSCLKVPLHYRGSSAVASLALRLQQSLEAAVIAYSTGLGTPQTLVWSPQSPSANLANFAVAGLPLVLPHVSGIPASPLPVPSCPWSLCSGGRGTPPHTPWGPVPAGCLKDPCSPITFHFVSLSCLIKIGGNSCAFPTQDRFQVKSGPSLQTSLCNFSNS